MQWTELTVKTCSGAIDFVADRLTVLGFDSFIIDDQEEFHEFLEQNQQYWDYVDESLEQQMQGLSQIRLYLESTPGVMETVSFLRDQLSALRAQYPSASGFWWCRSGFRRKIRRGGFLSCLTRA